MISRAVSGKSLANESSCLALVTITLAICTKTPWYYLEAIKQESDKMKFCLIDLSHTSGPRWKLKTVKSPSPALATQL